MANTQRKGFNQYEQRGSDAEPFRPPSLEVTGNYLGSSTQEDTVLCSPDVRQVPKGILRHSSTSSVSSVKSAASASSHQTSTPSLRSFTSDTSKKSERSAESLKLDQRRASSRANDIKAQIDELEKANRALDPQISHYQQISSGAVSFDHKNKALQEIKDRREQQVARERSSMFCLTKRVACLSLSFSPLTPPPLPCRPWPDIPLLALAGK